ncbi:hypothetical protein BT69DRAFT_1333006 [Atractiella rhizophila]|nr:hypothetical protein BT69DRAFT_1333006 [Atractiella rhizophila]
MNFPSANHYGSSPYPSAYPPNDSSYAPPPLPPSQPSQTLPGPPLPHGWVAEYDSNYQKWYFVDTRQNPPHITWDDPRPPHQPPYPPPSSSPHPYPPPSTSLHPYPQPSTSPHPQQQQPGGGEGTDRGLLSSAMKYGAPLLSGSGSGSGSGGHGSSPFGGGAVGALAGKFLNKPGGGSHGGGGSSSGGLGGLLGGLVGGGSHAGGGGGGHAGGYGGGYGGYGGGGGHGGGYGGYGGGGHAQQGHYGGGHGQYGQHGGGGHGYGGYGGHGHKRRDASVAHHSLMVQDRVIAMIMVMVMEEDTMAEVITEEGTMGIIDAGPTIAERWT